MAALTRTLAVSGARLAIDGLPFCYQSLGLSIALFCLSGKPTSVSAR